MNHRWILDGIVTAAHRIISNFKLSSFRWENSLADRIQLITNLHVPKIPTSPRIRNMRHIMSSMAAISTLWLHHLCFSAIYHLRHTPRLIVLEDCKIHSAVMCMPCAQKRLARNSTLPHGCLKLVLAFLCGYVGCSATGRVKPSELDRGIALRCGPADEFGGNGQVDDTCLGGFVHELDDATESITLVDFDASFVVSAVDGERINQHPSLPAAFFIALLFTFKHLDEIELT